MKRSALIAIAIVSIARLGVAQVYTELGKLNRFIPYGIDSSINSFYHEINPVLSPDEKTVYFSRLDHPDNHYGSYRSQDIWFSELQEDGSWSDPARVNAAFNENRFNAIYGITEEEQFLVSGVYSKSGKYKKRGLSLVSKSESGWLPAEKLKIPKLSKKDKGMVSTASINITGDVLILSYSTTWLDPHTNKIRYSTKKKNDKWKKPKEIKNNSLSKSFASIASPYISKDGKEIYFSAFGKKGANEDANDIYKITRTDNSFENWSRPIKLSDTINTNAWENYYKLFNENNWAIFSSEELGDDADIFIVKTNEPKPYVDLKGIVMLDNEPIEQHYEIMIDGQVVDSVRINRDSSSYAVQLPLGGKYVVSAKAFEMEAKLEVVDATYELEYLPLEKDLQLSLLPFLDLAGSVTVDGNKIDKPFTVLVNGLEVDSLTIDESTGTYAVRLPLGGRYDLEVKSGNYIPTKTFVDVSSEVSQIRIEKDLQLEAIPYVDIEGEFLDTKSIQPIPVLAFPKLMLNGAVVDSVVTENGRYKIRLPWGVKYSLSVRAIDYDPDVTTVDLTFTKNYELIKNNLYATPLENYATITGRVLNKKTDIPIVGSFFVEVDGVSNNTGKISSGISTYEVRVSLGKKILLTAGAENYFPISETVDLTMETEKVKVIKDLYLVPLEIGEKILMKNIFFETSSTNLKAESFADIDRAIEVLRIRPSLKIEIGGHTDSIGKDAFNLSLSEARAKSVVAYIIARGIPSGRVTFKGYGEASPVASNLTPEGRAKNRRVEFVVLEL